MVTFWRKLQKIKIVIYILVNIAIAKNLTFKKKTLKNTKIYLFWKIAKNNNSNREKLSKKIFCCC